MEFAIRRLIWRHRLNEAGDRIVRWVAWHLPERLVYWATIRLWAYATSGKWSDTIVPELEVGEALTRWSPPGGRGSQYDRPEQEEPSHE